MSYRYMRIIILFDLPMETVVQKREYSHFRKFLLRSGFIMMQKSVYSKLALNTTVADAIASNVKKNKPPEGLVQMLRITEKQYSRMEFLVGISSTEVLETDERLVVL